MWNWTAVVIDNRNTITIRVSGCVFLRSNDVNEQMHSRFYDTTVRTNDLGFRYHSRSKGESPLNETKPYQSRIGVDFN